MRKFVVLASILIATTRMDGQVLISLIFGEALNTGTVEFGLDGGVNFASLEGIHQAKSTTLWNLGFYFDIKLADPSWMIHTGVIVKSTLGAENLPLYPLNDPLLDSAFGGGSITATLKYFNVPIMLKHRFANNIFLEGGAALGLMYGASDEFTKSVHDEDDLRHEIDTRDAYHPLDGGIMIGAGYRLLGGDGMNLGIRYYHGLVDISIDDSTPNQFNRSIYLTVGIPIGAGDDTGGRDEKSK